MTRRADMLLQELFIEQECDTLQSAHELYEALATDERAASSFNELARLARALEGEAGDEPSAMERRFAEQHVMHALDLQLEQERSASQGAPEASDEENVLRVDFSRRRWIIGAAVALAAVALATLGAPLLLTPRHGTPLQHDPNAFAARGVDPATALEEPPPSLKIFCVQGAATPNERVSGEREAPFGVVRCPLDAELQFAYLNPGARYRHVAWFGLSLSGRALWYGPTPASPHALSLEQGVTSPKPLGQAIRLGVNHAPGPITVHALFSTMPIDYATLSPWVGLRGGDPRGEQRALEDLIGGEVRQVTARFEAIEVRR